MSELAFDANGEPLTFPASAEELRVRLFRNPGMRGACEVVHDKEGGALYVPIDITYLEFRQRVDGVPGRYRLDPVDASRKVLSNAAPAYVTISSSPRNSSSGTHGGPDERDTLIRDLVRANVEMATAISERFSSVMDRFANVVEVAVGAKQPRLEPVLSAPIGRDDEDDGDEDDDELDEDSTLETARTIERIANKGFDALNKWIMSRAMRPAQSPATAPAAAPAPAPAPAASPAAESASAATVAGASASASTATPTGEARNVAPEAAPIAKPTVAQLAHLNAIREALAPDEQTVCDAVVMKLDDEKRAHWLGELCAMTVEQAVAQVRALLPPLRRRKTPAPPTPPTPEASKETAP